MPRAYCPECAAEVPVDHDGRCHVGHSVGAANAAPGIEEPEPWVASIDDLDDLGAAATPAPAMAAPVESPPVAAPAPAPPAPPAPAPTPQPVTTPPVTAAPEPTAWTDGSFTNATPTPPATAPPAAHPGPRPDAELDGEPDVDDGVWVATIEGFDDPPAPPEGAGPAWSPDDSAPPMTPSTSAPAVVSVSPADQTDDLDDFGADFDLDALQAAVAELEDDLDVTDEVAPQPASPASPPSTAPPPSAAPAPTPSAPAPAPPTGAARDVAPPPASAPTAAEVWDQPDSPPGPASEDAPRAPARVVNFTAQGSMGSGARTADTDAKPRRKGLFRR